MAPNDAFNGHSSERQITDTDIEIDSQRQRRLLASGGMQIDSLEAG